MKSKVFFLHIPKTGGRTVNSVLRKVYGPAYFQLTTDGEAVSPAGFYETAGQRLASKSEQLVDTQLISGHFYHGVHEHIRSPAQYITILRSPVERVVSEFYFVGRPGHFYHEYLSARNMDITSYLSDPVTGALDNLQTRVISGLGAKHPVTEEHLRLAIAHLEQMPAFGITELMDESLVRFRQALGWKLLPVYQSQNVNRKRPLLRTIDPEHVKLISERESLDLRLYAYACERFQHWRLDNQELCARELNGFADRKKLYTMFQKGRKMLYPLKRMWQ